MLEVQSFKHMATILYYPMFLIRHRPSNVQLQRFKRPNIMSIACWRFSHLNTWRLYWIFLCSWYVIGHQTYKYQVNCLLEDQSSKHMGAILYYPAYWTRHRPSNVQIQRSKRPNINSIPCWRFSHLNTWRLQWIILCSWHVIGHQTPKYSDSSVQTSCQLHAGVSAI